MNTTTKKKTSLPHHDNDNDDHRHDDNNDNVQDTDPGRERPGHLDPFHPMTPGRKKMKKKMKTISRIMTDTTIECPTCRRRTTTRMKFSSTVECTMDPRGRRKVRHVVVMEVNVDIEIQ